MTKTKIDNVLRALLLLGMMFVISCGGMQFFPIHASHVNLETKMAPSSAPVQETTKRERSNRFYQTWWFWGAVMAVGFAGAAAAIAPSIGGTDRLAKGLDGSFDGKSFPNR